MAEEKEENPFKPRPGLRKRAVRRAVRITINAEAIQKPIIKVSQKEKNVTYCQSESSRIIKPIRNNVYNRSVLASRGDSRCVIITKKK